MEVHDSGRLCRQGETRPGVAVATGGWRKGATTLGDEH